MRNVSHWGGRSARSLRPRPAVWEPVITQSETLPKAREGEGEGMGRGGEESSGAGGPCGPRRMHEERASEQQETLGRSRVEEGRRERVEEEGEVRPNLGRARAINTRITIPATMASPPHLFLAWSFPPFLPATPSRFRRCTYFLETSWSSSSSFPRSFALFTV